MQERVDSASDKFSYLINCLLGDVKRYVMGLGQHWHFNGKGKGQPTVPLY